MKSRTTVRGAAGASIWPRMAWTTHGSTMVYREAVLLHGTYSAPGGTVPGNAVDGSLSTRWSARGDGQWLRLDLGRQARSPR